MLYTPKKFQNLTLSKLQEQTHMGLFFDMGLGKTSIILTQIAKYKIKHPDTKTLVIAPKSVCLNTWQDEGQKWDHTSHLTFSTCIGTADQRLQAFNKQSDIYIINRDVLEWLIKSVPMSRFDILVIDELSSFKSTGSTILTNPHGKKLRLFGSKRFIALNQVRHRFKQIYGLTGTPSPNTYLELFPQMALLYGKDSPFGLSFYHFRNKYYKQSADGYNWVLKEKADELIRAKLKGYAISLKAEDVLKMPDLIYNDMYITLDGTSYLHYLTMLKQSYVDLESGSIEAKNVTIKLMQLASGFIYDENKNVHPVHNRFIERLEEIVEFTNDNVLVFYNFKAEEAIIKSAFPSARKLKTQDDFKDWNNSLIKVGYAHPASIGHGINLQQGGHTIVWYGLNWSLELTDQALHRLYRQGQQSHFVTIHRLISKNTIHEKVKLYLEKKITMQNLLMEVVKMLKE